MSYFRAYFGLIIQYLFKTYMTIAFKAEKVNWTWRGLYCVSYTVSGLKYWNNLPQDVVIIRRRWSRRRMWTGTEMSITRSLLEWSTTLWVIRCPFLSLGKRPNPKKPPPSSPKWNVPFQNFGTPSFEENQETLESKNKEETLGIDNDYSFINTITWDQNTAMTLAGKSWQKAPLMGETILINKTLQAKWKKTWGSKNDSGKDFVLLVRRTNLCYFFEQFLEFSRSSAHFQHQQLKIM